MAENENETPEYNDEEKENGFFRWMSAAIVLLAVAGFFGLAWYAYKNGGEPVDDKDVEVIKADTTPTKEPPVNPGGMQIPNQDKTVYGLINGGKTEKPAVERVLPAPEEPVKRAGDTETWMSDKAKNNMDSAEAKPQVIAVATSPPSATSAPASEDTATEKPKEAEQFNPAKIREKEETQNQASAAPAAPAIMAPHAPAAVIPTPTPAPVAAATQTAAAAPQPPVSAPVVADNSKDVVAAIPAPAAPTPAVAKATPPAQPVQPDESADDTPEAAPEPKVAAIAPKGIRVQLGAYKSQAEADSDWKKIAAKFKDELDGKEHYIIRADLGDKGVFYRLQIAPFKSAKDAEAYCLDFVSAGQGCMPAKGK